MSRTAHVLWPLVPLDEGRYGTAAVARLAGVLWIGSGLLIGATAFWLPFGHDAAPGGVFAVAASAFAIGVAVFLAPWDRWHPRATLVLVPVAFIVIAAFNVAAKDPWLSGVFFLVALVWTGLAHPRGTCTASSPLLIVAYLAPDFIRADAAGVASAAITIPVAVVLGEAAGWVAERLRDAEAERRAIAERFAALLRHANDLVVIIRRASIVYASPGVTNVSGFTIDQTLGRRPESFVHPDDLEDLASWFEGRAERRPDLARRFRVQHADGSWRWIEGTFSDLRHDPAVGGIVINGHDVTERVAADEKLRELALRDPLTGLPNRTAFLDDLAHMAAEAVAAGERIALLYLDLDGFKVVNDSLGHAAGDELLALLARRLEGVVGPGHLLGRLGGDEFVVAAPSSEREDAADLADRLSAAIAAPVLLGGRRHVIGSSIGIDVRVPEDTSLLLRHADMALYRAKETGRGRNVLFDESLARRARRRLDLEAELRVATEADQLVCHYQPEIDLASGRITGVEALVRWQHPTRGTLTPGSFIDVAEETGLIVEIGKGVLRDACEAAARWRRIDPQFVVACNVSPQELLDSDLIPSLSTALARCHLPPQAIRLEVTEGALIQAPARKMLEALRDLGVSIAIDDFGTGYSSLSYLDRLTVDVLKIDQSFLTPIITGEEHLPVVEATLAMARSLQLHVVAEGIETPAQVALLRRLACAAGQGYYFGRPTDPQEISRRLLSQEGDPATAAAPAEYT